MTPREQATARYEIASQDFKIPANQISALGYDKTAKFYAAIAHAPNTTEGKTVIMEMMAYLEETGQEGLFLTDVTGAAVPNTDQGKSISAVLFGTSTGTIHPDSLDNLLLALTAKDGGTGSGTNKRNAFEGINGTYYGKTLFNAGTKRSREILDDYVTAVAMVKNNPGNKLSDRSIRQLLGISNENYIVVRGGATPLVMPKAKTIKNFVGSHRDDISYLKKGLRLFLREHQVRLAKTKGVRNAQALSLISTGDNVELVVNTGTGRQVPVTDNRDMPITLPLDYGLQRGATGTDPTETFGENLTEEQVRKAQSPEINKLLNEKQQSQLDKRAKPRVVGDK